MAIKITFTDTNTNQIISEETLTDEEVKALNTEIENANFKDFISGKVHTGIAGWTLNFLKQKSRMKVDEIVELSGKGSRHTPIPRKLEIIREVEQEKPELLKGAKQRQEDKKLYVKK